MITITTTTHYLDLDDLIPFGKYKNQYTVELIIMTVIKYIEWFQQNIVDYKFSKEALKFIDRQKTLNYAEFVSSFGSRSSSSNNSISTEVDIDMGGGSRDTDEFGEY